MASSEPRASWLSSNPLAPRDGWRVRRLERALGTDATAWDELNNRLFGAHPLLTSGFVDGLLRHFGDGSEHLCVLTGGGVPQAMCVLKPKSRWLWAVFRPAQTQIGVSLLRGTGVLEGLIEVLPGWVTALDLLCLDPHYGGEVTDPAHALLLHQARTMSIDLNGDFADYLATRPTKLRQNLRRYERRAEAEGLQPRHSVLTDASAVPAAVARYASLESRGWKGRAGTALGVDNVQGDFYSAVMTEAARRGDASVHELWIGEALAASRLVLQSGSTQVMLKTTYDESLAKFAPGRLLLRYVIEHAFSNARGGLIEFYTDVSMDQLAWATRSHAIHNVRLYRGRVTRLALQSLRAIAHVRTQPETSPHGTLLVERISDSQALPADVRSALGQEGAATNEVIFILRQQGTAVATLPMRAERGGAAMTQPSQAAFRAPPMAVWLKASDLRPMIRALREHWPRAHQWTFGPMDERSQEFMILRAALEAEGLVLFRHRESSAGACRVADDGGGTKVDCRLVALEPRRLTGLLAITRFAVGQVVELVFGPRSDRRSVKTP